MKEMETKKDGEKRLLFSQIVLAGLIKILTHAVLIYLKEKGIKS